MERPYTKVEASLCCILHPVCAQQLLNDTASVMFHPRIKIYLLTLRASASGTLLYC